MLFFPPPSFFGDLCTLCLPLDNFPVNLWFVDGTRRDGQSSQRRLSCVEINVLAVVARGVAHKQLNYKANSPKSISRTGRNFFAISSDTLYAVHSLKQPTHLSWRCQNFLFVGMLRRRQLSHAGSRPKDTETKILTMDVLTRNRTPWEKSYLSKEKYYLTLGHSLLM